MAASDFCDLSEPEPNRFNVATGTLFAAEPAASLLLAGLSATLHALALRGAEPAELAEELSGTLWQIAPDRTFAALFCARIDPVRKQLHYINAGNESALLIGGPFAPRYLGPNGPVLGLSRKSRYRAQTVAFEPGDTLLALTEGAGDNVSALFRNGPAARPADLATQAIAGCENTVDRTAIAIHFRTGAARLAAAA
jgi:serine phosphatase RsbU (regulator of sigma subunit)